MDKTRILIADDHALMRDGIRALLTTHEDMEVVGEAADGKEAIEKTQQLAPDVVIMDISMPRMDGLEAIRRIRKKQPGVKTLVLTQHDNQEYILSVVKAGASGFLPKKAVSSDLIAALRALRKGESFLHPQAASILIASYLQRTDSLDPYDTLTAREREILKLVAEGHTSRRIAEMLYLSVKTVTGHRNKLMQKLDLHNRTELVRYAVRRRLISSDA
jgi:DNA-binding NarL/FixJ family response regulator